MLPDVPDAAPQNSELRHAAVVRVTHWITAICFFALLISGGEIVVSHPRFYWGETGNDLSTPLFKIPIPASRRLVPTGYNYLLPDQNGWSRYLHFQAAWAAVLTGLLYILWGVSTGHFRSSLLPGPADRTWGAIRAVLAKHIRFKRPDESEALSYNVVQRATYLAVIFILFMLRSHAGQTLFCFAMACILSGAIGNVIDRLLHGYVIDFLDFHWRRWHFPAFNVADSAITIGAACLILDELLRVRRSR